MLALLVDGARARGEAREGDDGRRRHRGDALLRASPAARSAIAARSTTDGGDAFRGRRHAEGLAARRRRSCTAAVVRRARIRRRRPRAPRDRPRAARGVAPEPLGDAPAARGAAPAPRRRTCGRPARWSRRSGCASTSTITGPIAPTTLAAHRGRGQRAHPRERRGDERGDVLRRRDQGAARSRSSATSTATACACSAWATSRSSSAAARTCARTGDIGVFKLRGEARRRGGRAAHRGG